MTILQSRAVIGYWARYAILIALGSSMTVNPARCDDAHDSISEAVSGTIETVPNIVLVIADDMTWYDCGAYGSDQVNTPHIDRLASQGMRFDYAFTSTAMCAPTRQQLYTGMWPVRNGAFPNHSRVHDGVRSFVHHFEELGYRVGLAGKSHCKPARSYPWEKIGQGKQLPFQRIDEFMNRRPDQPFFLVIAANEPHKPWDQGDPSAYPVDQIQVPPSLIDTPLMRERMSRYFAEITYLDDQLGRVLELLEESEHAKDTIVIFTSEQGSQFPFGGKWTCYENGLRTALIVRWPEKIAPGSSTQAKVQYVDIVPTLIEAAGGEPMSIDTGINGAADGGSGFDGRSFLRVLYGRSDRHRDYVFGVHTTRGIINGSPSYPIRSVRGDRYKLILNLDWEQPFTNIETREGGDQLIESWRSSGTKGADRARYYQYRPSVELYDLENDPYELVNLAGRDHLAEVEIQLAAELEAWMRQQGDRGLATEALADERK